MKTIQKSGRPTEEEIDRIAELLKTKNYNSTQIAQLVGRGRNSIMGLVWRIPRLKAIGLPKGPTTRKLPTVKKTKSVKLVKKEKPAPVVIENRPPLLSELKPFHCRFPLWNHNEKPTMDRMLFCGEPRVDNTAYCKAHGKLCLTASIKKTQTNYAYPAKHSVT